MRTKDITTRAFFSLVNVSDNQRLIDELEGVPFLVDQVRISAISHSHATLTRDQYTETDPIIASHDRDMGVFIGNHRNENNNENNIENNDDDDEFVITVIPYRRGM